MPLTFGRLAASAALLILSTSAASADKVRVGTPEATAFAFAVIDVGVGAGIFAKHALDVERINFSGGSKLQQGMAAGAIDLSVAGNTELAFVAKGVPEIAVAVTAGAPVDMAVIVRADGEIKSPSDLKNKTIGVSSETSFTSYLALAFSRHQGWGNDDIRRAYIGTGTGQIAGLLVKNVDAIVAPLESGIILESEGKAHPLAGFDDMRVFIAHVMCASNTLVDQHPDLVRRFVAAWFETVKWMAAHRQETIGLVGPPTGLSPALAAKVYDIEVPALSIDGRFDPEALTATMQSFVEMGLLTHIPQDQPLYTEKFLP